MGVMVEADFKRWTAKRKAALATKIVQGKTSVSEAFRTHDLPTSVIKEWVDEGKNGLRSLENALSAELFDI